MHGIKSVRILKNSILVYRETPKSFFRPYTMNLDAGNTYDLSRHMEKNRGHHVNVPPLYSKYNTLITTRSSSVSPVIAGGYNDSKCSFDLVVEVNYDIGTVEIINYTGFTDRYEIDKVRNELSNDTIMYVNRVTRKSVNRRNHGFTGTRVLGSTSVLSNKTGTPFPQVGGMYPTDTSESKSSYSLSSSSVYQEMVSASVMKNIGEWAKSDYTNLDYMVGNDPEFVDINEQLPAAYLGKIVDEYEKADNELNEYDEVEKMVVASGSSSDTSPSVQILLSLINQNRGDGSYGVTGSFTYGELLKITPNFTTEVSMYENEGEAEYLDTRDITSTIAHEVINSLTVIVTNAGLTDVNVTIDTSVMNKHDQVVVTAMSSSKQDFIKLNSDLEKTILQAVVPHLLIPGLNDIYVDVSFSVNAMSRVSVSVEGGIAVPYNIPTYIDSVISPVVAPSVDDVTSMVSDVMEITDIIQNSKHK